MTAFTVWKYDDPEGAARAASVIESAEQDGLVKIVDHAVVSWPAGADRPATKHGRDETKRWTGWGALWGLLFGAMFALPVLGIAAGAATGRLLKAQEGLGITDEQLGRIRSEITEGTSALFLVTDEADLDRLGERLHGWHSRLLETNLTAGERKILMETVGGG
jgi:uncharacterized membrane protein